MIHCGSLQEVFLTILDLLLGPEALVSRPRGQATREMLGLSVHLRDPRNRLVYRLSRPWSLPFALGEFLWYMRGERSLATMAFYSRKMAEYSDDGRTLHSAYGARMFGGHPLIGANQWQHVLELLRRDADSRQAVIQIRTPEDAGIASRDHPCTLALQFLARDGRLHLVVTMRSNDVIQGSCYDIFSFTLMQEVMALQLGLELGDYYHQVGSWHLYDRDLETARQTLRAEFTPLPMPPMPAEPEGLRQILAEERAIREAAVTCRVETFVPVHFASPYWRDWQSILLSYAGWCGDRDSLTPCYSPVFHPRYQRGNSHLVLG